MKVSIWHWNVWWSPLIYLTGLFTCDWRICAWWDDQSVMCLLRVLLHRTSQCSWYTEPWRAGWSSSALSPLPRNFHGYRRPHWVQPPSSACTDSLPQGNPALWCSNGLCSSIMESKHIKAVKEPWRRSSRFDALCQMLLSNQCTDKLAAARADFKRWGMLQGTCLSWILMKLGKLYISTDRVPIPSTHAPAQVFYMNSVSKTPFLIYRLRCQ